LFFTIVSVIGVKSKIVTLENLLGGGLFDVDLTLMSDSYFIGTLSRQLEPLIVAGILENVVVPVALITSQRIDMTLRPSGNLTSIF
jgi:hypothetical protein